MPHLPGHHFFSYLNLHMHKTSFLLQHRTWHLVTNLIIVHVIPCLVKNVTYSNLLQKNLIYTFHSFILLQLEEYQGLWSGKLQHELEKTLIFFVIIDYNCRRRFRDLYDQTLSHRHYLPYAQIPQMKFGHRGHSWKTKLQTVWGFYVNFNGWITYEPHTTHSRPKYDQILKMNT